MCPKSYLLKKLAMQAKKRLIGGVETKAFYFNDFSKHNFKTFNSEEDEKFYNKVCQMLTENRDIHNPIGKLIDSKIYNSLPASSKEKYFFDLVDKYGQCKARYEKEHSVAI